MAEIVEENLRALAYDSERGVITHGSDRFLTHRTHWHDSAVDVFLTETEGSQFAVVVAYAVFHFASALEFLQLDAVRREPLAVGMLLGQFLLDFSVVVDFSLLRVDEQNLAWLEPTLAHHVTGFEVHDADLAGHHHHTLFGDGVA